MAETIRFTKMQGAGNDYIYVNTLRYPVQHPEEAARQWSAPHTGIGSDGLVLIGTSTQADFSMRIFNADGSEAMMCGNASRCIGKYVYDYGLTEKTTVTLDTLSGIKTLQLHTKDNRVETVTVDMGIPTPGPGNLREQTIGAGEYAFIGTTVSMGNPHLVIFTDNLAQIPLSEVGPSPRYGRMEAFVCGYGNAVRASHKLAEPELVQLPWLLASQDVPDDMLSSGWMVATLPSIGIRTPDMC